MIKLVNNFVNFFIDINIGIEFDVSQRNVSKIEWEKVMVGGSLI